MLIDEVYLAKALKLLNRIINAKEKLYWQNRVYYQQHGCFSPEYSHLVNRYYKVRNAVEAKLQFFSIYYDDEYNESHYLILRTSNGT